MGRVALRVVVRGIVQGVLFRASMRDVARANRVDGWVRNRPDGAVEALLEGEEIDVKKVLDWSERGPSRARVDSVTIERKERLRGLRGFRIVG
ncbi:MAG: acylphosphatase [Thaumarchaeota archaeon]|nr:MAG: acylphosphatase [Nitrososphaerota archaeon]